MKIFSLQSKTNIFIWSIVPGIILKIIADNFVTYSNQCPTDVVGLTIACFSHGWPFAVGPVNPGFVSYSISDLVSILFNFIFWILVSFVVLSLFKYFKNKH